MTPTLNRQTRIEGFCRRSSAYGWSLPYELGATSRSRQERRLISNGVEDGLGHVSDRLYAALMSCNPFSDRAAYGLYLAIQMAFHSLYEAVYRDAVISKALAGISRVNPVSLIARDLDDLGISRPLHLISARTVPLGLMNRLGWVYVSEISLRSAPVFLERASEMQLDANFGARHLRANPDDCEVRWNAFTNRLVQFKVSEFEEECFHRGVRSASDQYHKLISDAFDKAPRLRAGELRQ